MARSTFSAKWTTTWPRGPSWTASSFPEQRALEIWRGSLACDGRSSGSHVALCGRELIDHQGGGGFEGVDLPVHAIAVAGQHAVHVLGGQLGRGVGTDMTGLQAIADGQHIHTNRGSAGLAHAKGDCRACTGENG